MPVFHTKMPASEDGDGARGCAGCREVEGCRCAELVVKLKDAAAGSSAPFVAALGEIESLRAQLAEATARAEKLEKGWDAERAGAIEYRKSLAAARERIEVLSGLLERIRKGHAEALDYQDSGEMLGDCIAAIDAALAPEAGSPAKIDQCKCGVVGMELCRCAEAGSVKADEHLGGDCPHCNGTGGDAASEPCTACNQTGFADQPAERPSDDDVLGAAMCLEKMDLPANAERVRRLLAYTKRLEQQDEARYWSKMYAHDIPILRERAEVLQQEVNQLKQELAKCEK